MLNIEKPPVDRPSAVIVTTDSFAAATTFGRSASVMTLAGTAFGVAVAAAAGLEPWAIERRPAVEADASTAARTLAPRTPRRPREETRRAGVVGAGATGAARGVEVGAVAGGVIGAAGRCGIASAVILDHSVIWRRLLWACECGS
jgi:hypothetical protein